MPRRPAPHRAVQRSYPWHRAIVATTFWVGEIFDPHAADGSQVISTYDSKWEAHYGGCDGVMTAARTCDTEQRRAGDNFFPTHMTPHQNPFYLDLPYDDVNDPVGFERRCAVVPWADDLRYTGQCANRSFSYMKNRWVEMVGTNGHTCYGQIEDAGPGDYHDTRYVFGASDARPANARYGGAGADVSPALNSCLAFAELNGDTDRIDWRFVEDASVPDGPWRRLVTKSGVTE